jgi:hypothetical protein
MSQYVTIAHDGINGLNPGLLRIQKKGDGTMIIEALALIAAGSGGLWWRQQNKKKSEKFNEQFKAWLRTEGNLDHDLKIWVEGLSDEEFNVLTDQVRSHCEGGGLQLEWLWGTGLTHPRLYAILKETVNNYIRSRMQKGKIKEDVDAFKALQALERKPNSKENRALTEDLFNQLVAARVVSSPTFEQRGGAKKKRHQYMLGSIRQAAMNNPDSFYAILKQVLAHRTIIDSEAMRANQTKATTEASIIAEGRMPKSVSVFSVPTDEPVTGGATEAVYHATSPSTSPQRSGAV